MKELDKKGSILTENPHQDKPLPSHLKLPLTHIFSEEYNL